jgi:hypothetical protein
MLTITPLMLSSFEYNLHLSFKFNYCDKMIYYLGTVLTV